ncbi:Lrp/AsnC family transcriptional regulator [Aliishimia ponticola]|uniref:Lrp/AsnC family transcriptional regulator n=1 Tax=Aliishimia ponticola TaxID=2499833 RepID=A0A4S4N6K9_9RHOB|nr:Lrp/AsnC family transcriptional regulator [Aliishimia ponticola]THH34774.1 Lrp/AsnC family transcriptional regulator [Aliishimia ponticola]
MDVKIDEIDRRILRALQRDASLAIDALAEIVHLSRNACWRRVKRLESDGVIAKRVALLNPEAIGLDLAVFVLVRTNRHDEEWLKLFDKAVRDLPEITGAHRMSGDLDYVLRVRVSSVGAYDQFYKRLIARVPLSDISACFVMDDIKDTTEFPL